MFVLQLSSNTRTSAGVLLITILAVEYGGETMLRIVRGRQPATEFQRTCARAGHAHAGVFDPARPRLARRGRPDATRPLSAQV